MSSYCILQQDDRVPGQPTVLRAPEGLDPEVLLGGEELDLPEQPVRVAMNPRSGSFRGDVIDGIVTLFHDALRDELGRLGVDNVQYLPTELENPEGELEGKYSLVNVVGLVDAVDRDRSRIEPNPGGDGLGTLYEFEIDPEATRGLKLFRIVHAPTLVIVSPDVARALIDFAPAGAVLKPTSMYDGWE